MRYLDIIEVSIRCSNNNIGVDYEKDNRKYEKR